MADFLALCISINIILLCMMYFFKDKTFSELILPAVILLSALYLGEVIQGGRDG